MDKSLHWGKLKSQASGWRRNDLNERIRETNRGVSRTAIEPDFIALLKTLDGDTRVLQYWAKVSGTGSC